MGAQTPAAQAWHLRGSCRHRHPPTRRSDAGAQVLHPQPLVSASVRGRCVADRTSRATSLARCRSSMPPALARHCSASSSARQPRRRAKRDATANLARQAPDVQAAPVAPVVAAVPRAPGRRPVLSLPRHRIRGLNGIAASLPGNPPSSLRGGKNGRGAEPTSCAGCEHRPKRPARLYTTAVGGVAPFRAVSLRKKSGRGRSASRGASRRAQIPR